MAPESADPFSLAVDQGFLSELAGLRAKATLKELLGTAPDYQWAYTAERAVRNATALHLALKRAARESGELDSLMDEARVTAQAWESLATLEERTNRSTALMNAAVAYEVAGYQANAACVARASVRSTEWSAEPTLEGIASAYVQRLLLRVATSAEVLDQPPASFDDLELDDLGGRMATALGVRGLAAAARFLLNGDRGLVDEAIELLNLATEGFAELGDVRRSNLMSNLQAMLPVIRTRSTWSVLGDVLPGSRRWNRYLKVLARGLGARVLDSRSISELWPSQLAALEGGLLDTDANNVVRLPTSAGKTRVAEMAIVHKLTTRPGARCLYVAPFRALVTEVEESFANLFADLGYAASSVPGAFDQDAMDAVVFAEDQILVLTPEKLDLVLRLAPDAINGVELIVLDEGHIVGDRGRGARYELLVSRLKRRLPEARMLLLSAVIPEQTLEDFASWIGADSEHVIQSGWRPSLQRLAALHWSARTGTGVLRYDSEEGEALARFLPNLVRRRRFEFEDPDTGKLRHRVFPGNNKGHVAAALAFELAPQGPVLIFCGQTNWARAVGNALGDRIELAARVGEVVPPMFAPADAPRAHLVAQEWLGEDDATTKLLRIGVGVHHGRQPEAVRLAIEEDFRNRRLGVLVATNTLAQGVNLPVRTVIIHTSRRYDEETASMGRIPARDYWNIAGRAGRAGEETEGTIIHIVSTRTDEIDLDYYRRARNNVEPVTSALYSLLTDLVDARISSESAANELDAELLALLVEEAAGTLSSETLDAVVNQGLVGVQARRSGVPTHRLISAMASGSQRIAEMVPDEESRQLFSATGLRTASCVEINQHIQAHDVQLSELLAGGDYDDLPELLELLLEGLGDVEEMQPRAAFSGDTRELLTRWMIGTPVAEESAEFVPDEVSRFVEEFFSYLLPWGISGYLHIAANRLDIDQPSPITAGLPALVKYGVPSLEASWAMAAGVPSRRAAMVLAGLYRSEVDDPSPSSFRRWLSDLNPEELTEGI